MKRAIAFSTIGLLLLLAACEVPQSRKNGETVEDLLAPGQRNPSKEGPEDVRVIKFDDLEDSARNRNVPTTVYAPKDTTQVYPLILLSHGLGGDRSHYVYLAKHLGSHGYVVVVPEHVGSSSRLGAFELVDSLYDEDEWRDRVDDCKFLIDQCDDWNLNHPQLAGIIDTSNVGVTGHSYGGATTQWMGGAEANFAGGLEDLSDPRVRAIVPLAAGGANHFWQPFTEESFENVQIPVMHIAGEDDRWREKKSSHDNMPGADKFFLVLDDTGHLDFTDADESIGNRKVTANLIIKTMATVFFDVYLKDDRESKKHCLHERFADAMTDWRVPDVHWYRK